MNLPYFHPHRKTWTEQKARNIGQEIDECPYCSAIHSLKYELMAPVWRWDLELPADWQFGQWELEPILVQPLEDGNYQILNGHYRVRAVRRLRHQTIWGRIYPCDRRIALVIFCTSNLLTKSLSALEEALMMHGLIKEGGFSLSEVGELWGHSKSWVSRRLKLLTDLDPKVKRELEAGHLKPRLAQELARLPQGDD